jgi:hypothetical protein
MKKSPLTNFRWLLLVWRYQVIQSDALRNNHTSGIAHLAGSTRDVGAADHCESVAAGLHMCRFCEPWLLCSSQCYFHRVAQRQRYGDYDYSEGDKFDQVIRPFFVGISITEETRSANTQRVGIFHGYITPFTNEMTILSQYNGQLFCLGRSIAKVTPLSVWRTHDRAFGAML